MNTFVVCCFFYPKTGPKFCKPELSFKKRMTTVMITMFYQVARLCVGLCVTADRTWLNAYEEDLVLLEVYKRQLHLVTAV